MIRLIRYDFTPDGIFGQLSDESGTVLAATLEHSYNCLPKLAAGTYKCVRRVSPHFGYELFCITGVEGHDYIEIHIGNLQKDSTGCVLLGLRRDGIAVLGSKLAFDAFMNLMKGKNEFDLEVSDADLA
jgi:hypothetical protein